VDTVSDDRGILSVDEVNFYERKIFFAFARWAYGTLDGVAGLESE
jgi:hypothetical protein